MVLPLALGAYDYLAVFTSFEALTLVVRQIVDIDACCCAALAVVNLLAENLPLCCGDSAQLFGLITCYP